MCCAGAMAAKHEFRATWFATVTNIDWPTAPNLTIDQQKAELKAILDKLQAGNINAVCLQVRSQGDALYESSYEPWAVALTGTRGNYPGYDPLEYAIQEAHNRGMELHAWVNPFRMSTTEGGRLTEAQVNSLYKGLSWSWVLAYNNVGSFTGQIIDPGYPEARKYIKNVVMEIVDKYDIDGILMDDYFYPYGGTTTEDSKSKSLHKPNDVKDINGDGNTDDDWRRSNVDALVKLIYDELNTGANKKPWVRFGLAPFGVWTVQPNAAAAYGISLPNGISGQDCYEQLACNPIEWIKNGYIDYVSPQLYWPTATSPNDYRRAQDYHILYNWWSDICTQFSKELPGDQVVQFYPSHSADRVYGSHQWGANEMRTQVGYNQKKLTHGYSGSVFFSTRFYLNLKNAKDEYVCGTLDSTLCEQLHASHYQHKALVPPMAWKATEDLVAPNTLRISGNRLTWQHDDADRFTVYIYPKGVRMSQAIEDVNYLQGVVYGKSFALPNSFDITTHNVAVRSYDRYGVEHEAAEYGPDVTYVLNGGVVESVPTNEELWASFKKASTDLATLGTLEEIATQTTPCKVICTKLEATEVQEAFNNANWTWLKEYIARVQNAQKGNAVATSTVPELTDDLTAATWRYAIAAFFLQTQYTAWPYSADFTTAGKPEAWGPAYQAANGGTGDPKTSLYTLPDFIDEPLTLPTASSNPRIYHPSEYTFLGWIDQTGTITELSDGYKGTVYAQWDSPIKWVLNGGVYTGHEELPLTVNEEYYLPTAFAMRKEGYKFAGWYGNASFTGGVITTIPANYTGTLYAKWGEATHVTWHPYPYYDVTNEDLWELFIEDYNAFYQNRDILGENRSYENRAYQPIGNAFGFMHSGEKLKNANGEWINKEGAVVGTEAAAHHRFPDGRAKDFMTHPQSPWKWLGDYIHKVASDGVTPTNEALWEEFKPYYNEYYLANGKLTSERADQPITDVASFAANYMQDIMTNANSKYKWLGDYISGVAINQGKSLTNENAWRWAVHAFFNCYDGTVQGTQKVATANFSIAGKPENWTQALNYPKIDYSFDTNKEVEWRKHVHTFFNKTNSVTYTVVGNTGSKTETTVDFSTKGQSKPNGDPAAGWYNAWWNATFPEYMMDNEALPKVKRCGYVFGGWYYGNDKGYIFTEGTKADTTAYDSENNYKNHLWGRWLELCLYEGYVDADPAALDANEQPISPKVNNNVEMVICNAEEIDRTKVSRKVDVERKLIGGIYNTMFLPFGINGQGTVKKDDDGNYISGSGICGKKYYLNQVVDDDGNPLLDPATTSILVYDGAEVETIGGEKVIAYNFHEYAEADSLELLLPYQPFLIKPANDITVRMHFWSALMNKPKTPKARTDAYQVFVEGVLAPTMLPVNPEYANTLILVADNRLAKVTTQGEMLGLRLYFTVPKDVSPSARSIIRVNNAPAGIDDIETPQQGAAVIKIMQNGNIYIIRNGKMYDIMGREIGDKR